MKESFQGERLRDVVREGFDQNKVLIFNEKENEEIGGNIEFKILGDL